MCRQLRTLTLVLCLLVPSCLVGQNPVFHPQSVHPALSVTSVLHVPASRAGFLITTERLALPQSARDFKFTKVDLELLKQVNAFDTYMEEKGWVYNDPETNAYLEKVGLSLVPKE